MVRVFLVLLMALFTVVASDLAGDQLGPTDGASIAALGADLLIDDDSAADDVHDELPLVACPAEQELGPAPPPGSRRPERPSLVYLDAEEPPPRSSI